MRLGTWLRNKASDFAEETILESETNWCRYRSRDGHCHLPCRLNPFATTQAGWAVWELADRGACNKDWAAQTRCPIAEAGADTGGAPLPVPWHLGGQRDQPIVATRLTPPVPDHTPGTLVQVHGHLAVLAGVNGRHITLDDDTVVDSAEVLYPAWHPTAGLDE